MPLQCAPCLDPGNVVMCMSSLALILRKGEGTWHHVYVKPCLILVKGVGDMVHGIMCVELNTCRGWGVGGMMLGVMCVLN